MKKQIKKLKAKKNKWTESPFPADVRGVIIEKTKLGNIIENSDGVRFETIEKNGEYFYRKV